ncbi:succinate-semialdehyde dehydrogenase [Massilia eurypsychrophila]|jgi:succinate-semialdehyde dehydrogenase/glutarate-semialdehyde dehydrogenase|uniref:Succinate-semialdehyde dehydrogenase n=1 Tax=Massilia eurypsychrophila TaxID=1485217 RepID=A0A2G8TID0_9BURK|nr:NAD-dependent succinate-semialdehyde dehydrogenase [Massilia eurypsychrophila]PIL45796.1 succinate-semialdehyde dehydrogenase [Massilia eurypsychrophila]
MAYQSINPFNGKTLASFDEHGRDELDNKLQAAQRCFDHDWRQRSYAERAIVVKRAAALMRERADELAKLITLEMGKLIAQAAGEVALSAAILDYYADNAEQFLAPEQLDATGNRTMVESSPLGVLLGIEPWNYPYYQIARFAAPNLMAGNVVMVKHASNVPQCALAFEKCMLDAGAPAGAYSNLFISKDQISQLIDDPRIRGVALTGSEGAGAVVAAQAGKNLKKSTLELGGSDAFIVLEDADLDKAVKCAVAGRMGNSGQACTASKRFIVLESVADRFLEKFQQAMGKFSPGDPLDEKTTLAPLSTRQALDDLVDQVDRAVAGGASVLMGGSRIPGDGAFMQPTILTDVAADNPTFREEFFGPVAMFFRVPDEDAAVALANDSPFGLGGSIMTQDIERGRRLARRIDTGMVFINSAAVSKPELPFGGVKNSGYGRELSSAGIDEFVNKKLIRVA